MSVELATSLWLGLVSVLLGVRAVAGAQPGTRRRLAHVERYGLAASRDVVVAARLGATDAPAASAPSRLASLGQGVARRIAPARVERVRHDLLAAGHYSTTAETFLGLQLVVGLGAIALGTLFASSMSGGIALRAGLLLFVVYAGFVGPATMLSRRARTRLEAIDREMPELVDVLVVAIEAGLGVFAALDHATSRMSGPLHDELRLVLQEQGLGASTKQALEHLADRCDGASVRSFARAITQGDQLGISVGQTMRALAVDLRKRRLADAEERAHKTPIKIMLPLVFCIFPSMFVVLLAPAALSVMRSL